MHGKIVHPGITFGEDRLKGNEITHMERRMKDLAGVFEDEQSYLSFDPETLVYEVDSYFPVEDGTPGGLFFGLTVIHPGKVGNEYFMTKGHFHEQRDRAEYYWGIKGRGMLIFMDQDRNTWGKIMTPGSLHYIPSYVAHRVANTGTDPLAFCACWPSDAGHDYGTVSDRGFSARLIETGGVPTLK
jgi:glucose-6-phosphate isomerase